MLFVRLKPPLNIECCDKSPSLVPATANQPSLTLLLDWGSTLALYILTTATMMCVFSIWLTIYYHYHSLNYVTERKLWIKFNIAFVNHVN